MTLFVDFSAVIWLSSYACMQAFFIRNWFHHTLFFDKGWAGINPDQWML